MSACDTSVVRASLSLVPMSTRTRDIVDPRRSGLGRSCWPRSSAATSWCTRAPTAAAPASRWRRWRRRRRCPPGPRSRSTSAGWSPRRRTRSSAYKRADASSPVVAQLRHAHRRPTTRPSSSWTACKIGGQSDWYDVWLPIRPTRAAAGSERASWRSTRRPSKIVIDLSRAQLYVYQRGALAKTFPVAVGRPGCPRRPGTSTSTRSSPADAGDPTACWPSASAPSSPSSAVGPAGGQVAIHGTNEPWLIGKAVSHGCVRMHNPDVSR